ncbi:hypothetical protein LZ31DRAFT_486023, partial [Colletotrichum somersetense]
ITINKKNSSISISLYNYTKNIISKFNKGDIYKYTTPVDTSLKLVKDNNKANKEDIKLYQQQIGCLIWLAIKVRINITFTVNLYARFIANPNNIYFKALDRI